MQKEVISNLYKRKIVAPLIVGSIKKFIDSFADADYFIDSNLVCDIIGIKDDTGTESG